MNRVLREFVFRVRRLETSELSVVLTALSVLLTAVGTVVNLLLIFVTAALALYAYRQWVAVDKTLDEIKQQTPAIIQSGSAAESSARSAIQEAASSDQSTKATLEQMKKQSESAQILAKATQDSVSTSMRQLELAERPNLILTDTRLSVAVNHLGFISYDVSVSIANTGHNPATNTGLIAPLILPPGYSGSVTEEQTRNLSFDG